MSKMKKQVPPIRSSATEYLKHTLDGRKIDEISVSRNFRIATSKTSVIRKFRTTATRGKKYNTIYNRHGSNYGDQELDEVATVNPQLTVQKDSEWTKNSVVVKYATTVAAKEKALTEYRKYKAKTLESVEKEYLKTIAALEKQAKKESRKNGGNT